MEEGERKKGGKGTGNKGDGRQRERETKEERRPGEWKMEERNREVGREMDDKPDKLN